MTDLTDVALHYLGTESVTHPDQFAARLRAQERARRCGADPTRAREASRIAGQLVREGVRMMRAVRVATESLRGSTPPEAA